MAGRGGRRVNIDDPRYGYFWTETYEEVITYVNLLMERGSVQVVIHSSAIWESEAEDLQVDVHQPPLDPLFLDEDQGEEDLTDIWQETFENLTDPEQFELDGSGLTLNVETFKFWFQVSPYQPNNNPNPTSKNSRDANDQPPPGQQPLDGLAVAIAWHHLPFLEGTIRRKGNFQMISKFIKAARFIFPNNQPTTLSTLAQWHQANNMEPELQVWNKRGNLIYSKGKKRGSPVKVCYKNNKWYYIKNLQSFLQENFHAKTFCYVCRKFHGKVFPCMQDIQATKEEFKTVKEKPPGRHGLVIYADFEAYTTDQHKTSGFGLVAVENGKIIHTALANTKQHENIPSAFLDEVEDFLDKYVTSEVVTPNCQICGKPVKGGISSKNFIYAHAGSHHKECLRVPENTCFIYFHNFKGYDSHFILREIRSRASRVSIMGKSMEKMDTLLVTQKKYKYRINDTFNYLSTALANIVKGVKTWRFTPERFRKSKGQFPYEWFNDPAKLDATSLPADDDWFNKLNDASPGNDEAKEIWQLMNMKTFAEYHDFYLQLDVMQLADAFEEFRDAAIKAFNTDVVYFQGAPSYSWYLGQKLNEELFKIIPDKEIYMDVARNIRGGVSQCIHRYFKVANPGEYAIYLDINSLYSSCMMKKLPCKYLKKLDKLPDNWEKHYCGEDADAMLLIKCDLHYPEHLHDRDYQIPLAPHHLDGRLVTSFEDKEEMLVSSHALKYYMDQGLVLVKVHYAYAFTQEYILKKFIAGNIKSRQETTNPVMGTLYKLLNNSIYGKTCENKFKYRKFGIHKETQEEGGAINEFLGGCKNATLLDNETYLTETQITEIVLDKPIQIGFQVLEYAKLAIYEFVQPMMAEFGEDIQFCYTDTDSLLVFFKNQERHPFVRMRQNPAISGLLDLEKNKTAIALGCATPGTNKVAGLWSDEVEGKTIQEFVGLRAKSYAIKFSDGPDTLKNKGVRKNAKSVTTGKRLDFDSYKQTLFSDAPMYVDQYQLQSKLHNVKLHKQRKLALSSLDYKRHVLADKIRTLPFGYKGEKFEEESPLEREPF
uniref:DNA-directed DNA polymerase n=1 Tax=Turdus naumanni densovirus TaxID=2794544 RepID=A0A8A4XE50_9VIRU|nr:MAG: PolB [Turdus naumanni densovirus]